MSAAGANENGTISASGKWKITNISIDNEDNIKNAWGVTLNTLPDNPNQIGFIGSHPPYKLIITYDDPNLGKVMILSKR